ncbi:MAG: hypothetical protein AAFR76_03670 [Planctomycetota bacterium]
MLTSIFINAKKKREFRQTRKPRFGWPKPKGGRRRRRYPRPKR